MQLAYSKSDILASHRFARLHVAAGYQLHGGFDEQGRYVSPRSLNRWPAIVAWTNSLEARGGVLLDCSRLLNRPHYPTVAQQNFLLGLGLEQPLWNSITRSSLVEADGVKFTRLTAPDFQLLVDEELSNTATGHLNRGLLLAHGLDEGEKGHDLMWLAVRDLMFGKNAFPDPPIPPRTPRPRQGQTVRQIPEIPENHETFVLLLIEVLMFEVLAEGFFQFCIAVLANPDNFRNRKDNAIEAIEIIRHIREDEKLHVGYLNLVLSELRSVTFKTVDGTRIRGEEMIDRIWKRRLDKLSARNRPSGTDWIQRELTDSVLELPNGNSLVQSFNSLGAEKSP